MTLSREAGLSGPAGGPPLFCAFREVFGRPLETYGSRDARPASCGARPASEGPRGNSMKGAGDA
jgi:hypothetical protein